MTKTNIAIFASGSGSNCENIILHYQNSEQVSTALVVCNRPDAFVLERARRLNVPSVVITKAELNDAALVMPVLRQYDIRFIVLAGFLPLIPDYLIEAFPRAIVNLHPALLPKYGGKGMWGHHVHEAVKAAGESETGMTVHWVTPVCDGGEIIAQYRVALSSDDSVDDIAEKEHQLEMKYFPKVLDGILLSFQAGDATVVLRQLTIGYALKSGMKTVASGLDGQILRGQLTCLLGPNGVGKSTLLRTLSAFQPSLGGDILLDGRSIGEYSDKQLSRLIGVVLTEKPDVRNMTVRELVGLGRSPYTGFWGALSKEDYQIVDESIRMVGIEGLSQAFVDTLSDGERQKVMIAKALAQQTPVIFLDEPTAFLDFPSKVEVMQLLRRLAQTMQKTVFMSTHDLELALQVADTVWLMQEGTLSVGTPRQLADNGTLGRFVERGGILFDRQSLSVRVL